MSHPEVRSQLRRRLSEWITDKVAQGETISFQETVNDQPSPAVTDTWITCGFYGNSNTSISASDGKFPMESGTCDVYVFTRAGTGDAKCADLAQDIADYFHNDSLNTNPNYTVAIESVEPISEAFEGDERKWYGLLVSLNYLYGK